MAVPQATDGAPKAGGDPAQGGEHQVRPSLARDLLALTKPRVISLLLVTAVAPMFITGLGAPPLALVGWVLLGGFLMAGGANAINMWFDQDIDHFMSRTRQRPVPAGRVTPAMALVFGIGLGSLAFAILWRFANPLSAWLALGGLLFYVLVYTVWLKRSTPQNIVIGGAAGAFPPLVGYAAMAGHLDLTAWYLFAIIFFWTPPHFWALALYKSDDYARAGIPMLPVVAGDASTRRQILRYTLILTPLGVAPWALGFAGPLYGLTAAVTGAIMVVLAWQVFCERRPAERASRQLFAFSILYLFLLFAVLLIERGWGGLLARLVA